MIRVHPVTRDQLLTTLAAWINGDRCRIVCYMNARGMKLYSSDHRFRTAIDRADLVFCDGFGAKWIGRILGLTIPERMTPPDWIDALIQSTEQDKLRLLLLGDEQVVVDGCADALRKRYPSIQDIRTQNGFFEFGNSDDAGLRLASATRPNLSLVGMGMPRQENWLLRNQAQLPPGLYLAVGGLLRYYGGFEFRGPRILSNHGFEWLSRLVRHPIKHFRRYFIDVPLLVVSALRFRISKPHSAGSVNER